MSYRYATERPNFADLASGQVFHSLPGHPAFPVRLASEVFQRCLALRGKGSGAVSLYDPCCGAAYHLSILAYLHWDSIRQVTASDVDARAVQLAEHNLSLLTPQGLERRIRELGAMQRLYGRDSHRQALESAARLQERVVAFHKLRPIQLRAFQADALDARALAAQLGETRPEVVFTDLPYGQHSHWQGETDDPAAALLAGLLPLLGAESIVAISSVKGLKLDPPGYRRVEKLKLGKREIQFFQPG
jgi:hypothetical protein